MNLTDMSALRPLMEKHGFRFSKALGQNFLIAPWVPEDIAAASGAGEGIGCLEIGPGVGCLTKELCRRAGKVISVELDERLLPVLHETVGEFSNLEIVPGDIMALDLERLVGEKLSGLEPIVAANLPYNITTPVITKLLTCRLFRSITVMVQKEVADRICAGPGTGQYGAFTLLCDYYAGREKLFAVPSACFEPRPKVDSAVVRLTPRPSPPFPCDEALLFRAVRGAFNQRRKTLSNALASAFPELGKGDISAAVEGLGRGPSVRGEVLNLAEFARLTEELEKLIK